MFECSNRIKIKRLFVVNHVCRIDLGTENRKHLCKKSTKVNTFHWRSPYFVFRSGKSKDKKKKKKRKRSESSDDTDESNSSSEKSDDSSSEDEKKKKKKKRKVGGYNC